MAGIVGYGAFVPRKRIRSEVIAQQWGKDPGSIRRGLMLEEKSVPGIDEDTITISVEAARSALARSGIDPRKIGAVYIGSESHPYARPHGPSSLRRTPPSSARGRRPCCSSGHLSLPSR